MALTPRTSRTWLWAAAAALVVSFMPGRMALTDPDEARYAQTSREMLRGGDIIVPRFNGEPRLNKPPLIYWVQAAAFLMLGETETAARLPSLLAAIATLGLVAWWAERRLGAGTGGPAAAALAVTLLFFACARLAITDMLLTLTVTAGLLLWHESVASVSSVSWMEGQRRHLAWAAAAAIGLSALIKGPVGPALAGGVILATAAVTRGRQSLTWRGLGLAAAGVILVAGPWVAGLAGRIGVSGILELLQRESVERSVLGLDHPRPSYYYLLTWWGTLFPWSLAAPVILIQLIRTRRDRDPVTRFLLCWLGGTLLFFSLSADKNDAYLLPAAPALALLVARWLPRSVTLIASGVTAALLLVTVLPATAVISRNRSLKGLALAADLTHRGDYVLIAYRLYRPSLVFYSGKPAYWVSSGSELRRLLEEIPQSAAVALVITDERLEKLRRDRRYDLGRFEPAGRSLGHLVLFRSAYAP